jgi:hypothetical protein
MDANRINYDHIALELLERSLASFGVVEIVLSESRGKAFVRYIQHNQKLENYLISNPGWVRRNWDFICGLIGLVRFVFYPRLLLLYAFSVTSNAAIGWQKESNGEFIIGFLSGSQAQPNQSFKRDADSPPPYI